MKHRHLLLLVLWAFCTLQGFAQVSDLEGLLVAKVGSASSTLKADQWYLFYNRGRSAYNYESPTSAPTATEAGTVRQSTSTILAGDDITAANAGYLVQLVPVGDDSPKEYYIMTGHGHWFCDVTATGAELKTTADISRRAAFTIDKCATNGHWWLRSASGFIVDGNGNGSTAVGYGTDVPTKSGGNNDHAFYPVTPGTVQDLVGVGVVNRALKTGGIFRFVSQRTTTMSMTEPADHKLVSTKTDADDASQLWLLQPLAGGGVALRNYATGRYVQQASGASTQYTTAPVNATLYAQASPKASATKRLVTLSSKSSFSDKSCLHDDQNHRVVNWAANNSNGDNPYSDWTMTPVEDYEPTAVKDHFDAISGQLRPAHGVTVQIRNVETGYQISESGNGRLLAAEASAADYSQYWVLEADPAAPAEAPRYAFRNVMTGHYIGYTSGTGNGSTQSASASKKSYYVISETADVWHRTYHISGASSGHPYYTHTTAGNAPTETPQPYIINTDSDDARTHWIFVATELSADEIEAAQLAYKSYVDIQQNASAYTAKMETFFTDASCSDLKPAYESVTADELRTQMEAVGLPEYLIRIALKIKDNTWSDEDEMARDFRIADYQVYSHFLYSKNKMGMSQGFGRLTNPTGIVVKAGDVVTFFCDHAAPSGSELKVEAVQGTEYSGVTYNLSRGINIFNFAEDATLYIFYQINDASVNTRLASCPDVRIHIEGGRLNGYYDKTRGHDDSVWRHLRTKLLKHSDIVNIKTPHVVFCFNSKLVQQACPSDMERLLRAWDAMIDAENELMGYDDVHHPGLSEVQRNVYNFFSKSEYIGGLMMAGLNGVQCMESSIPTIMNADAMESEGLWGPAHECGHLRQYLILMIGTLESSNNLFSNVAVYKQGRTTQRAAAPQTIFDHFATRTPWIKYDIWETTHMMYQLYLYYHVLGINPDFYPSVFLKLLADPMDHQSPDNVRGADDYLKVARVCCEVAQADLSEFFATYGFFEPVDRFSLYENRNWTISTTQAEIDATLQYMHQFPKKLGNILFIEDRILPVPATYEGHKAGEVKKRRGDDPLGSSAKAGDVGQYSTYLETPNLPDYYYSVTAAGKVTVHGTDATGLVGFKVYDEEGRLACVSNTLTFTLPEQLRSQRYTLVAAMGDGSDIALTTDIPAGIGAIEAEASEGLQPAASSAAYDLQGRAVSRPASHGVYISGGKKVVR